MPHAPDVPSVYVIDVEPAMPAFDEEAACAFVVAPVSVVKVAVWPPPAVKVCDVVAFAQIASIRSVVPRPLMLTEAAVDVAELTTKQSEPSALGAAPPE
jgi:hypothetical protein